MNVWSFVFAFIAAGMLNGFLMSVAMLVIAPFAGSQTKESVRKGFRDSHLYAFGFMCALVLIGGTWR